MTNNGVTFNTEGPMMSGTWYNPSTGDSFTVMDNFFEDNQFMVATTDGRMLNYDQLQYYVQSDKPITPKPSLADVPASITSILEDNSETGVLPDESCLINGNLFISPEPLSPEPLPSVIKTDKSWINPQYSSSNYPIIEKALSKTILPTINIQLDWEKYPEREIEMLQDIMEVPLEEIVDWYINKFGITEIKKLMETSIKSYFNINKDEPETVAVTSPAIKKTKSKKK